MTSITRSFFDTCELVCWKNTPSPGMSPRIGSLVLAVVRSSLSRPPMITEPPSLRRTVVVAWRVATTGRSSFWP